jgi:type IV pilus assembly protein PilB
MYANYINFRATMGAIGRYLHSRIWRKPLVWLKTDHSYPALAAATQRRRLGEILVSSGNISQGKMDLALRNKPAEIRLGEYLVKQRLLTEDQVYRALSLQAGIPFFRLDPRRVRNEIARSLPARWIAARRTMPFQITGGFLFLASPEVPHHGLYEELGKFTCLQIRVQLVTKANFEELRRALL